ncbi:immunity 50 family protein [Bacillus aquiflavi]|uniref:immunity 50 family protein n=1 Tax=Bacillus aquiflavi TaxID=2672567 RepID=UPI001CA7FB15|nr:immunity 50 family protein [Bacillus aquiflavi]UAC48797.1 immunity 50 family protein [Bacillus aquiflavi]
MINEFKFLNPQALTNIFGKIPTFEKAELLDIQLNRDGPILSMRLMTKDQVKIKPKRWNKWDVVYIELFFFSIRNLEISRFGTNNLINEFIVIDKCGDGLLEIKCDNQLQIKAIFDWGKVEKVTPGLLGLP